MKTLDGNTMIPLGIALAAIGGGAFWLSAVNSKVDVQEKVLIEAKMKQERIYDDIGQIRVDLGIIKELLNREKER